MADRLALHDMLHYMCIVAHYCFNGVVGYLSMSLFMYLTGQVQGQEGQEEEGGEAAREEEEEEEGEPIMHAMPCQCS